jgi:hypothetical protein
MKSTRIEINDDDQFAVLEAIRTHYGVNWRGMLIQGAEQLEAGRVFPSELEFDAPREDE